jgi:hypothetical protein
LINKGKQRLLIFSYWVDLGGIRAPLTTLIYPLCVWVIRHVTIGIRTNHHVTSAMDNHHWERLEKQLRSMKSDQEEMLTHMRVGQESMMKRMKEICVAMKKCLKHTLSHDDHYSIKPHDPTIKSSPSPQAVTLPHPSLLETFIDSSYQLVNPTSSLPRSITLLPSKPFTTCRTSLPRPKELPTIQSPSTNRSHLKPVEQIPWPRSRMLNQKDKTCAATTATHWSMIHVRVCQTFTKLTDVKMHPSEKRPARKRLKGQSEKACKLNWSPQLIKEGKRGVFFTLQEVKEALFGFAK